jgi:hypothetical protein
MDCYSTMSLYSKLIGSTKRYFSTGQIYDLLSYIVLGLAIILPYIVISAFPKFFHASDIDEFWRWSQSWNVNWKNIYVDCTRCNYPFIGTLASAGVMSLIGADSFKHTITPFRFYLATIDALNLVILFWILKKFQVKYAALWAGFVGLSPSSWIGTSVWGQIDGTGFTLILLTIILFISFNLAEKPGLLRYYLFIFITGLLISLSILSKQLLIFSLISVGFMALINIIFYTRKIIGFLLGLLLLLFSVATPILLIDSNLYLKPPFISHLQYVWETGGKQSDMVTSFGLNIWEFFVSDRYASSHDVINIRLNSVFLISFIPYNLGIVLFILSLTIFSGYFLRYLLTRYRQELQFFDREMILGFLFHLALVNLSFNLFLTGVHERYLFYFYPFLILTWLGLERYSPSFTRKGLYVFFAGAIAYGSILWIYLTGAFRLFGLFAKVPFQLLTLFNLGLFVYLMILFVQYFKPREF